jgi:predicted polyphosphate/ATP-dependent NAD kinase
MRFDVRNTNISLASPDRPARRLGFIVNPIAGLGGPVGLKGTDGEGMAEHALALGGRALAPCRAAQALEQIRPVAGDIDMIVASGNMGAAIAASCGLPFTIAGGTAGERADSQPTSSLDTARAARAMAAAGVEIILFAGGDGTARDIVAAAPGIPLLGIPAGVKMHSAVFAASPASAGHLLAAILRAPAGGFPFREAELVDIDEAALRNGVLATRLYGVANVPLAPASMQASKAGSLASDEDALDALARTMVREMETGCLYVLGCGSTIGRIKRQLGFEGTLLGIDVVLDGRVIATDVGHDRLLRLVSGARARIVVSVTGGQGFVFGRGNQQISPDVLRAVGRGNVTIVTGARKLALLDPAVLRVDTGDGETDAMLAGYWPVRTAPRRTTMMRVAA